MQATNIWINGRSDQRQDNRTASIHLMLVLAVLFFGCFLTGCHSGNQQPKTTAVPTPSPDLQNRIQALDLALASHKEQVAQLKADNAGLKIQIFEYASLIQDIQNRSRSQQQRLDAAIVEVVRSKARLRSLESKAEAASTIAEAEIAISGLKKQIAAGDSVADEEVSKADQLVKMSALEFKDRNFGGALYLANQAKGQAQALRLRYRGDKTAGQEDETLFAQPLPLTCLKNSNLRSGPGLDKKIFEVLVKGTRVMGYAYKEGWVRVETRDGRSGWLSQSLISAR